MRGKNKKYNTPGIASINKCYIYMTKIAIKRRFILGNASFVSGSNTFSSYYKPYASLLYLLLEALKKKSLSSSKSFTQVFCKLYDLPLYNKVARSFFPTAKTQAIYVINSRFLS